MKRLFLFAIVAFFVLSCNVQVNKPETVNESYEPTNEELYAACADLRGVGQFVIGETTFKAALNDKDFKNSSSTFDRKSNLYNGHWGYDFWKTSTDDISGSFEKSDWIEKAAKGRIKQLIPQFGGIKVGDLEFHTFDMAFLNDTLVAIFFYPDDKIEDVVINHYKEKYGDGRGRYKYYSSSIGGKGGLTATTTTDEKRTWANEKVALDYVNDEYFHMEPGREPTGNYKHSLMIYSRSRYPVFEDLLKSLAVQYDENKQEKKSSTLNTL